MHPADLVMAYLNLTNAGLSPDGIAPREYEPEAGKIS
jgi:ParB family chromosome partitioning protein